MAPSFLSSETALQNTIKAQPDEAVEAEQKKASTGAQMERAEQALREALAHFLTGSANATAPSA